MESPATGEFEWRALWVRLLSDAAPGVASDAPDASALGSADRPECRAWALMAGEPDPHARSSALRAMCQPGDGPLLALGARDTIETWTEGELCTLHAAMRLLPGDAWWHARLHAAVQWHLEWTQPDNATNRPWAIHAFLALGDVEGRLYAETMLHNAQAGGAQGDPLVRWALADAARWLARGIPLTR